MQAIGSLAGGIAHDFNNLLTVILGYSGVLAVKLTDTAAQTAVDQIKQAAVRAAELTAQLLAFSRQQVMQSEVTDVNAVVTTTLQLLERLLGDDIVLEQRLDPDLASILVDRTQLGQVILNLAVNGRDAMKDGGTLTITTENVDLDDGYAATHRDVIPGPHVLVQVADSGAGMDDVTRSRVFDPFFTTKAGGTGLGLSTVYGVVKQSGGHALVVSEPGAGTVFRVYFPASTVPAAPTPTNPAADNESVGGTETILVVEDDDALRFLVATALEAYGYAVLTASGGHEALEIAADERTSSIDLMLTDVRMPLMNGWEVAERMTAAYPGLPVLFTSGYPSADDGLLQIARAGGAFIQKPFSLHDLASRIRGMLNPEQASTAQNLTAPSPRKTPHTGGSTS